MSCGIMCEFRREMWHDGIPGPVAGLMQTLPLYESFIQMLLSKAIPTRIWNSETCALSRAQAARVRSHCTRTPQKMSSLEKHLHVLRGRCFCTLP